MLDLILQVRNYATATSKNQYPKLARSQVQSTTATPFAKFAISHATTVCGDVFVTVALAESIFFSAATSEARGKVLLYLLLTMAPFAVVAPFLGPLLDRSRGGRRIIMIAVSALRGVICLVLANHLKDLALYPLALSSMVLTKTQSITKSAIVPAVVNNQEELVSANSRLAMLGILAGMIGAPIAGLFLHFLDGAWVLRAGAFVFFAGAVLAIAVPKPKRLPEGETEAQRGALHIPSIIAAGSAMGFVRGVVGFMTFFGAFVVKSEHAQNWFFGVLLGASALGNGIGTMIAAPLRRRFREEWMLVGAITIPAILMVFAARVYSVASLAIAAGMIAGAAACGRLAFDSLLQRDAHEAVRGRAIARFETRFQLVWVCGGVLAVAVPTDGKLGLFLIALVMLSAGFAYLGAVRRADTQRSADASGPADEPEPRSVRGPNRAGSRARAAPKPAPFDFQADDERENLSR